MLTKSPSIQRMGKKQKQTCRELGEGMTNHGVAPRDPLHGTVKVNEAYWGGQEKGVVGRLTEDKTIIIVVA